jgi:hypothetical protein
MLDATKTDPIAAGLISQVHQTYWYSYIHGLTLLRHTLLVIADDSWLTL